VVKLDAKNCEAESQKYTVLLTMPLILHIFPGLKVRGTKGAQHTQLLAHPPAQGAVGW